MEVVRSLDWIGHHSHIWHYNMKIYRKLIKYQNNVNLASFQIPPESWGIIEVDTTLEPKNIYMPDAADQQHIQWRIVNIGDTAQTLTIYPKLNSSQYVSNEAFLTLEHNGETLILHSNGIDRYW